MSPILRFPGRAKCPTHCPFVRAPMAKGGVRIDDGRPCHFNSPLLAWTVDQSVVSLICRSRLVWRRRASWRHKQLQDENLDLWLEAAWKELLQIVKIYKISSKKTRMSKLWDLDIPAKISLDCARYSHKTSSKEVLYTALIKKILGKSVFGQHKRKAVSLNVLASSRPMVITQPK